jgi:hypothetical protein
MLAMKEKSRAHNKRLFISNLLRTAVCIIRVAICKTKRFLFKNLRLGLMRRQQAWMRTAHHAE